MSTLWAPPKGKVGLHRCPLPHLHCGDHMAPSGATVEGWQSPPCTLWPAHSLSASGIPPWAQSTQPPTAICPWATWGRDFAATQAPQHPEFSPGLPQLPGLSSFKDVPWLWELKKPIHTEKVPRSGKGVPHPPLSSGAGILAPPSSCPGWLTDSQTEDPDST